MSQLDFIINDDPSTIDRAFPPGVSRGYVERDYAKYPETMFAPPSDLVLIPRSEWSDRIKEKEASKSRISDILLARNVPSIDQTRSNYCWGHSTVQSVQTIEVLNNKPYTPLSAYMVCSIIMKGANDGGWCGLSAKFLREVGVCSQKLWPQGEFGTSRDNPEVRADAAMHKVTEDFVDLTRQVYDQNLTFDQLATCLLLNIPCATDFSWWSHSVMACDLVEVERGSFGIRIRNSWGQGYGDRGFAVLQGSKAFPNGAVATRVSGASA